MKKIDVEKSVVHKFDNRKDLAKCVELLGENGYFSDNEDFSNYVYGTLAVVISDMNNCSYPFIKGGKVEYKYFIPEGLVMFKEEPKEKKYRPYEYMCELPFNLGDVITYRCKQCCSACDGIVTEIEYQNNDDFDLDNIIIGGINGTPQELFDHYEFLNKDCEWVPFGVEE